MWWLVLVYLAVTALVIVCAVSLSSILDQLDKRTKISSVFLGGFILAVVTSLPDLFTAISSVIFIKEPALAFGGILGGNIINMAILSFFIALNINYFMESYVSKKFFVTTIVNLIVCVLLLINAFIPSSLLIKGINLNGLSIIIVAIYTLMLCINKGEEKTLTVETFVVSKYSIKTLVWLFVLSAVSLILCSIGLSFITNVLADYYMIEKSLAGALFLGLATTLPEIITTIFFIKKKNFNLAVGSIIGSVAFNWIILVFVDILYVEGTIFLKGLSAQFLTGFLTSAILLTSIILLLKCYFNKNNFVKWLTIISSFIIIIITLTYIITAFYLI